MGFYQEWGHAPRPIWIFLHVSSRGLWVGGGGWQSGVWGPAEWALGSWASIAGSDAGEVIGKGWVLSQLWLSSRNPWFCSWHWMRACAKRTNLTKAKTNLIEYICQTGGTVTGPWSQGVWNWEQVAARIVGTVCQRWRPGLNESQETWSPIWALKSALSIPLDLGNSLLSICLLLSQHECSLNELGGLLELSSYVVHTRASQELHRWKKPQDVKNCHICTKGHA